MKKLMLAVMAVALTACTSLTTGYRSLASIVVPTNIEMVAEKLDYFSGQRSVVTYCSGVAVNPHTIITAGHCTKAAKTASESERTDLTIMWDGKVKIRLQNGKTYLATIVKEAFSEGDDKSRDWAVLQIDEDVLTYAAIGNSDDLAVGDELAIVGNSYGEMIFTFSTGVVSYINRELKGYGVFIQTTAFAAPGNSGGGVFDMHGRLIGILTRGGGGISFVVPINLMLAELHGLDQRTHGQ